jgi:hypothetical protein
MTPTPSSRQAWEQLVLLRGLIEEVVESLARYPTTPV